MIRHALQYFCLLLFTFSPFVGANDHRFDDKVEKLLAMKNRPTVSDMLRTFRKLPRKNPFALQLDGRQTADLAETGPWMIASFERAFPGAIWAALGRDAVLTGDILDAFYTAMGQPGRVQRLNASRDTFEDAPRSTILKLMLTTGFNPSKIASAPPYVIFDRTGFTMADVFEDRSQSAKLFSLGADAIRVLSPRFAKIPLKLNVISSHVAYRTDLSNPDVDPQFVLQRQMEELHVLRKMSTSMSLPFYTDSPAWHAPFGELVEHDDGSLETRMGVESTRDIRIKILFELFEVIRTVQSPEFLKAVHQAAKEKFGYDLKTSLAKYHPPRPLSAVAINKVVEAADDHLDPLYLAAVELDVAWMHPANAVVPPSSPQESNGSRLMRHLDDLPDWEIADLFFLILTAHEEKKITDEDLFALTEKILFESSWKLATRREKKDIVLLYEENEKFREFWTKLASRYQHPTKSSQIYHEIDKTITASKCAKYLKKKTRSKKS